MKTLLAMVVAYGAVLTIFGLTKTILGIEFNPVLMFVSPAIVSSMFMVGALNLLDSDGKGQGICPKE